MNNRLFTGSGVAIVTPFNGAGVNAAQLERQIEFQISGGTQAIIACGTTGEPPTMSAQEKETVIRTCIDAVNGRVQVVASTGGNNTAASVEASRNAQSWGADALLVVTPYYNKATQKGLIAHYTAIADAVDIPIIVYNVPSRTGLNMLPDTFARLSEHANICGMKEASGNIEQITELMRLCGDSIALFSGNDDHVLPLLALGGQGVISVSANIIPAEVQRVVELYMAGDIAGSRAQQFAINPLNKAMFCEVNPIPIKTAMRLMGMDVGPLRLPLTEMEGANLANLQSILSGYHLLAD